MTIKLYCMGESGNAYKAALPLELSGLEWEPVFVDFFNGETRGAEFRATVNCMGEVPTLIDGDFHMSQSGAIQKYITDKSGRFGGKNSDEEYAIFRWVLWDNHKFSSQAGMTRFLINFLAEEKRPVEVIEFFQARLKSAYDILNKHLAKRDWIVGDSITHADFSCCGYLFYPEHFGFERNEWSNIDRWMSNIESMPGWKHPYDLMPRKKAKQE